MNPDLEKWIDEASKGLEPLAREKITEQITEHYQDAVLGYRSSGLGEDEARSRAMLDLGNTKQANTLYSHSYFTDTELKNGEPIQLTSMISLVFPLIFMTFGDHNSSGNVLTQVFLSLGILFIGALFLIKYSLKNLKFKRFMLSLSEIFSIIYFCSIVYIWIFVFQTFEGNNYWALLPACAFIWMCREAVRFYTKLERRAKALV
jgi:hypothetical protein